LDTESKPDLERSLSRRFAAVPDDVRVTRTAGALEANGISVVRATDAEDAKRIVLELVPAGAQVHNGASQSLVNKVLIINREYMPGRITVVFVDEVLGF